MWFCVLGNKHNIAVKLLQQNCKFSKNVYIRVFNIKRNN